MLSKTLVYVFAGCATTLVAAEKLGRRWVRIDEWRGTHKVVVSRLRGLSVSDGDSICKLTRRDVFYERRAPIRTDVQDDEEEPPPELILRKRTRVPPYQQLSDREIRGLLADAQKNWRGQIICAGCGLAQHINAMDLDHRTAKSAGGADYITNRVVLCRNCNGRKGNRLTLAGLWADNVKKREIHNERRARDADEKAR